MLTWNKAGPLPDDVVLSSGVGWLLVVVWPGLLNGQKVFVKKVRRLKTSEFSRIALMDTFDMIRMDRQWSQETR